MTHYITNLSLLSGSKFCLFTRFVAWDYMYKCRGTTEANYWEYQSLPTFVNMTSLLIATRLNKVCHWPENTNLRGSITVCLTSCLFCLDSAALFMLNDQQFYLFGQIKTSQTGGLPYSDASPMVSVLCTEHPFIYCLFWLRFEPLSIFAGTARKIKLRNTTKKTWW